MVCCMNLMNCYMSTASVIISNIFKNCMTSPSLVLILSPTPSAPPLSSNPQTLTSHTPNGTFPYSQFPSLMHVQLWLAFQDSVSISGILVYTFCVSFCPYSFPSNQLYHNLSQFVSFSTHFHFPYWWNAIP